MRCYGREYGKKEECPSCDCREYCKDAADVKISKHGHYEDAVSCDKATIQHSSDIPECESDVKNLSALLMESINLMSTRNTANFAMFVELLAKMRKLTDLNYRTYQIAMSKLLCPEKSYASLAQGFGCDKQLVEYHLKKAVAIVPELKAAFLIDRRFLPKKRNLTLRRFSGGPVNHEGSKRIRRFKTA